MLSSLIEVGVSTRTPQKAYAATPHKFLTRLREISLAPRLKGVFEPQLDDVLAEIAGG